MPYLGTVPAPAVPAFYLSGENAHAAIPVPPRPPRLHQRLDAVKDGRLYDGRMVPLHIILRHFALVDFFLFGEEIHRVNLLEQGVAFVFLVGEDGLHHRLAPHLLAARSRYAFFRQYLCDLIRRMPVQEQPVDFPHRFRLPFVDDEVPVLSPVVAEEPAERDAHLAVREPLPHAPGAVLRNAPALLLRQRGHDGDEQLALGIEGPDVLLLKITLAAVLLQLPDGGKAVDRVPCEP